MKTDHDLITGCLIAFVVLCLTMYGCNVTSEVELTKRQAIVGTTNAPLHNPLRNLLLYP